MIVGASAFHLAIVSARTPKSISIIIDELLLYHLHWLTAASAVQFSPQRGFSLENFWMSSITSSIQIILDWHWFVLRFAIGHGLCA